MGAEELSDRQKQILRLVAQHMQAKQIARVLSISHHTVKAHKEEARRRLGVGTTLEAAQLLLALEEGPPSRGSANANNNDDVLSHEHTSSPTQTAERPFPADLVSTGNGLESPRHAATFDRNPRHTAGDSDHLQAGWASSGRYPDGDGHGMVVGGQGAANSPPEDAEKFVLGERKSAFARRLKALTVWQCLALVVIASVLLTFAIAALITGTATTIQAIQNLTGQTR